MKGRVSEENAKGGTREIVAGIRFRVAMVNSSAAATPKTVMPFKKYLKRCYL